MSKHIAVDPVKIHIDRAWKDFAPKVLAFLTGGTAATAIVAFLNTYAGVTLDPGLAALIVTLAGSILGYFVKDSATVDAEAVLQAALRKNADNPPTSIPRTQDQREADTDTIFRGEDI